jgi:hypothetical protein
MKLLYVPFSATFLDAAYACCMLKAPILTLDQYLATCRMEMEMLNARCGEAENGLSSASHDVALLSSQREQLQMEVRHVSLQSQASGAPNHQPVPSTMCLL